jgi:ketopantoate reductase
MHVAIVGAGALGRVYGVHLAKRTACNVTFVVRPGVMLGPIRLERVDDDGALLTLEEPRTALVVPPDVDVICVTVRAEQLGSLDSLLEACQAPIVVITPMMPQDFARMSARYGPRLRAGMAGAVAYVNERGTSRYWLPRLGTTLIDDVASPEPGVMLALVDTLVEAGLRARLERGVHELNPATTVAIAPVSLGLDAAGSIEALLHDETLLPLTLRAIEEGVALSARIGKSAGWLRSLTPYLGKRMLRVGAALVKSQWPETFAYVELHFGRKLHAQNISMARAIVELAETKGTPNEATRALLARIEKGGAC